MDAIKNSIISFLSKQGIDNPVFTFEYPTNAAFGDYTTNVAMAYAKTLNKNPRDLAQEATAHILDANIEEVKSVSVAGPGFINITLNDLFFTRKIERIVSLGKDFGKNEDYKNKKVLFEYTDPNIFKEFHIGHFMTNAIGESLSRLFEFAGSDLKRSCYYGDTGVHIGKSIWSILKNGNIPDGGADPFEKVAFIARNYVEGAAAFEQDEEVKKQIKTIGAHIYNRDNEEINKIYDLGRKWSLEYFDKFYKLFDTHFDFDFFESVTGPFGFNVVQEYLKKGVFEESDGAVVFRGEKYGLHTRVFINSLGVPVYEAKDLGLAKIKYDTFPYDYSFIVTLNEITEYFKVILKVMSLVFPDLEKKTTHFGHGMMKLKEGKMSSRTGKVLRAIELIEDAKEAVRSEIRKRRERVSEEDEVIVEDIAISAIRFSILKQSVLSDVVVDFIKDFNFEGDTGPYLQYTAVRIKSILKKAAENNLLPAKEYHSAEEERNLERLIIKFEEVVVKAREEMAPHLVAHYLLNLSHEFNRYYGETKVIDGNNPKTGERLLLLSVMLHILNNGLWLLGIKVPERM